MPVTALRAERRRAERRRAEAQPAAPVGAGDQAVQAVGGAGLAPGMGAPLEYMARIGRPPRSRTWPRVDSTAAAHRSPPSSRSLAMPTYTWHA